MASYRHLARSCVMQAIFALEFNNGDSEAILKSLLNEFAPQLTDIEFAEETLAGITKNKDAILGIIQKYAPDWPVDKIARIDRAILEIGIFEIVYSDEIPSVVAINEAVELAKHFGDENSPKFVNGVLSSVMKAYNKKSEKTGTKNRR